MKCNKCDLVNPFNTIACKRCQEPLSNNAKSSGQMPGGLYRDRNLLVIELRTSLPKRCYKCNSPNITDHQNQEIEYVPYLQKRLKWAVGKITPAAGALPLTPGRRAMELQLYRCSKHRSSKPLFFKIGVAMVILSPVILFLSARFLASYNDLSVYLTVAMAISFTLGLLVLVAVNMLKTAEVDKYRDSYFWVKGFGEEYLKSFPNLADAQKNSRI